MREEIKILDLILQTLNDKLKYKFKELELMRTYFYSKELDYELKKEITELQMAYNYIEELKTAIIASMSE
jgi:hypothetical protein